MTSCSEEWGGDTIVCPISAKTGQGIDNLLENLAVLLPKSLNSRPIPTVPQRVRSLRRGLTRAAAR